MQQEIVQKDCLPGTWQCITLGLNLRIVDAHRSFGGTGREEKYFAFRELD
jgi:hypothetical protein